MLNRELIWHDQGRITQERGVGQRKQSSFLSFFKETDPDDAAHFHRVAKLPPNSSQRSISYESNVSSSP